MTLEELLSELRNNILHDRSDAVSGDDDRLWSDATLVRYINEAQRRFARRSLILRDGTTPEVTQVVLKAGQTIYPLHPSVIAVVSARYGSDAADLVRAGHDAFNVYRSPDPNFFDLSQLSTLAPGRPRAYSTDEHLSGDDYDAVSVVTLRVYPAPTAAEDGATIYLRVARTPLENLSIKRLHARPEIPEDYQIDMLDWAAYLALRIVDRDAGDLRMALNFRTSFEEHVTSVRREVLRKMFAPAMWGFGQNGFAWER